MRVFYLFHSTVDHLWPTLEDYLGECIEWSDGKVTVRWRQKDTNSVYDDRYVYEEGTFNSMADLIMPSHERHFMWYEAGVLDKPETVIKYLKYPEQLVRDLKAARNHTITATLKIQLPEEQEG